MSAPTPVLSGQLAGRYTIVRPLGRGATATVYLAYDDLHQRQVAVKVLRGELADAVSVDRFSREIRLTAGLQHPHIVPLLDSGKHEGMLYFVLPYLDGGTLRERLQQQKQLPLEEVIRAGCALASALAFAHEHRLVHRDVKPENVLYRGGQVCLADFGIARALEHAIGDMSTSTGIVRGTPAYMSPEQAAGERDYDGRSDIYSLGCVLYEAAAGVAPYVGPSAHSVVAQRLSHPPQPIHHFRPGIPQSLEAVLHRALEILPADRFQTAEEFARALEDALPFVRHSSGTLAAPARTTHSRSAPESPSITSRGRPAWIALAAAIVLVVVLGLLGARTRWAGANAGELAGLDTTRLVILPFDVSASAPGEFTPELLLADALRPWRGISIVESFAVSDAVRRFGVPGSLAEAGRLARELGAARFILGRTYDTPSGSAVYAALYDVVAGELYSARVVVDPAALDAAYVALADSLLSRGAGSGASAESGVESWDVRARHALRAARVALAEWDLPRADSLFARAATIDPSSAAAQLWTAQVRLWRDRPTAQWEGAARHADAQKATLSPEARLAASAIAALADGRFADGCDAYGALVARDSLSFVGWYGLGDCRRLDRVVVEDPRSPTGWRFRSSYHQAVRSYTRALSLLPSAYRGFEQGGYRRLQSMLLVSTRDLIPGATEGEPQRRFLARPMVDGDTLVLVPFPWETILAGSQSGELARVADAVVRQRRVFHDIASRWSASFPASAEAKQAIAVSLELQGDPAAVDSAFAAAALATEPMQRLHLTAGAVFVRTKFALPDRVEELEAVVRSADSLLRAHPVPSAEQAHSLAPLAGLLGQCARASAMLRRGAAPLERPLRVPAAVVAQAAALEVHAAMGCTPPDSLPSLDAIAARIVANPGATSELVATEQQLLGTIIGSRFPAEPRWLRRLASSGNYLLAAQLDALEGDGAEARRALAAQALRRRAAVPGDVTPDGVLPEARLWLHLGDTAAARAALESSLEAVRLLAPLHSNMPTHNTVLAASLVRAMALRAELSAGDRREARRWSRAVQTLWSHADDELQPAVARMRALAR